ncbi:glycosyltransferase [Corynebacterium sp. MSK150]|uniref:CgeB family protein n=1 Tax=Corynebacterium sp. MSK150 TaxID=3050209 RepID=UPI00254CD32C|nr:glycosyltransferase [Corynebacterium sp. MSK150]MDK8525527.1 glycosyltransferase [Corynebacterium sp. MSK150]
MGLATKKWAAASLAGSAVLASQTSSFLGDLNLGRAVSKTRMLTEKARREMLSGQSIASLESQLLSIQTVAKGLQSKPSDAVKSIAKKVEPKPFPAADPKSRRTGAPVNQVVPKAVAARGRVTINGDEAEKWVASRTGGESFTPAESDIPNRAAAVPFASEVPVAMIADDFTYYSFREEFKTLRLTPSNWKSVFTKHKPQVFFCESAWQGGSPQEHPWQGKIYASVRWPKENRAVLLEILDYCHKNNIPTVFWNKEDPTHFSDRINDFLRTAALFDYVFTTAAECVEGYKKDVGCNYVDVLPFAVQPKLFNPIGIENASDAVNFAGTWYGMYPERCEAQAEIMDQVLDAGLSLVIYDRMKSSPNPIYRYPERFEKFTREPIVYEETAKAYKEAKYGITMNTVADSDTMFARRVFELAASGCVVLSNEAKGVRNFFGDSVIYADSNPQTLKNLTPESYRALQRNAMNVALRNTYTHRAETILEAVGVNFQKRLQAPAMVAHVSTFQQFDELVEAFEESSGYKELLVIVRESAEQSLEFKLLQKRVPNVTILNARSIENDEYRTRSFLSADKFVYSSNAKALPATEELEELQLHTAYFDGQIRFTNEGEQPYIVEEAPLSDGTLTSAQFLKDALRGGTVPTFRI